ncbi:MAG: DUF4190 domain-containing protein [Chloracidobacterium sp.]|nr:DUF4190 domain-containing protein [Chloracidobacterium sp.]
MKKCPKCGRTYTDKDLNFCYEDGELLSYMADDAPQGGFAGRPSATDEPPPTEFLGSSRVTNENPWPSSSQPPAVWQQTQPEPQYAPFPTRVAPNQTLALVSMILGVSSVTVGWCCYTGIGLAPAAIVVGIIALSQIKKDPERYTGRGLALAGIISGAVYLFISLVFIIIYIIALILGSFAG